MIVMCVCVCDVHVCVFVMCVICDVCVFVILSVL